MREFYAEYANVKTGKSFSFTTTSPNQLKEQIYEWSSNDPSISPQELSAAKSAIDNGVDQAVQVAKTIEDADQDVLNTISKNLQTRAIWIPLALIVISLFATCAVYSARESRPTPRPEPSVEPR